LSGAFICAICGRKHEGPVTDRAYRLPDAVWALSPSERTEGARFTSDLCEWGARRFIRAMLEVPFLHTAGSFGWGAWAEVDQPVFERYRELYDADGSTEPLHAGRLANDLPAYPGSLGTPVLIRFRDPAQRPLLLPSTNGGLLAREQRTGIGAARYGEILHLLDGR
jgi:hypothetical protein